MTVKRLSKSTTFKLIMVSSLSVSPDKAVFVTGVLKSFNFL
jgi:hypothetical protein